MQIDHVSLSSQHGLHLTTLDSSTNHKKIIYTDNVILFAISLLFKFQQCLICKFHNTYGQLLSNKWHLISQIC